ncbi:MAG: cytochrome C [Candidatus Omnitrophota bacterium]|jgi:hypothetical protein|nr:MAG: cytochrome C [Candidatus Omnitrophota bacterium]
MTVELQNQQKSKPLSDNWITTFGFILALAFLVGETIIIAVDLFYGTDNPYVGILIYLVGPAILVFGLLLVPLGMIWEHRRRLRGVPEKKLPVFDLNNPRHRLNLGIFAIVTTVFLALSMVGSYQAYHITESTQFCGLACHQVMQPEYTAYQNSPHARVDCVQCHIGPGADWYVKSKLSGVGQVIAVLTNSYELPIDTPIENLRPARDTCEQCHWPEKFYRAVEKSLTYYASDEENTPYRVDLLLHVGGEPGLKNPSRGIHWHVGLDHKLEYYASDEDRQKIPWIRVSYDDGRVEEFVDSEVEGFDPATIPAGKIRIMDCIDCHNRPSHRFHSPFQAVNEALEFGRIDPKLPEIKLNLIELLQQDYPTTHQALETIENELLDKYKEQMAEDPSLQTTVNQAIEETKRIYGKNFFPEWKVEWSKFPWHIGHFEFPGCYRCHNDKHTSVNGDKVISNDCALCHTIIRQGEGWDNIDNLEYKEQKFLHPRGYEDAWVGQNCHECHGPGMM